MKLKYIGAAILGLLLGLNIGNDGNNNLNKTEATALFGLGISKAYAGRGRARRSTRRVARRTARRTSRRVAYRNSVAGCSVWRTYWNCGGVYYARQGDVYIIVNP